MIIDTQQRIVDQIKLAIKKRQPVNIVGGNSKTYYGRTPIGKRLLIDNHKGIINYEPSELVITAKAGTKIDKIQSILAGKNQMLGFEPALCNKNSTLGGVVASGLAGPTRPYRGGVRDFVLGIKMINGRAQVLNFGGQVMKNVAGFDHSRLMAGAMGTLGVLLEVSLRIIPIPEQEITVCVEQNDPDLAIVFMNKLVAKPLPISAATWVNDVIRIRLSGSKLGVKGAIRKIGGDIDDQGKTFWTKLMTHQLAELNTSAQLLRASLPAATKMLYGVDNQIIDWGGAQRWAAFDGDYDEFNKEVSAVGGHITQFRGGDREANVFAAIDPAVMRLHHNLKRAFDPQLIFNPGRIYKDL